MAQTAAQKAKVAEASKGLKKLTVEQVKKIKELYDAGDERFAEVEKLVHKSILFKITGDIKYMPKANRNIRAEQLNSILFS